MTTMDANLYIIPLTILHLLSYITGIYALILHGLYKSPHDNDVSIITDKQGSQL